MSPRFLVLACAACQLAFVGVTSASSCAERMNALEIRINQAAEAAASASSGGQGVAAARESQAMQSRNQGRPIEPQTIPPFQQESKEAQAEARALDTRGDGTACLDLIGEAERQLGNP